MVSKQSLPKYSLPAIKRGKNWVIVEPRGKGYVYRWGAKKLPVDPSEVKTRLFDDAVYRRWLKRTGKRGSKRQSRRNCRYGVIKAGPYRGECMTYAEYKRSKLRERKSERSSSRKCRYGIVKSGSRRGKCMTYAEYKRAHPSGRKLPKHMSRKAKTIKPKPSKPKPSKRKPSGPKKSTRVRGCVRQTSKKYTSRPGPPYPANECVGQVRKGNDGLMYRSELASNGVGRWKKIKKAK